MIEHKYPLEISPGDLKPWLSPAHVTSIVPLPGWHNSIYRVDLSSGKWLVLRVHIPDEGPEFVEPTLRIAAAYASTVPFVPTPLTTRSGEYKTTISGRTATLWPYIEGVHGESNVLANQHAAECLASLHIAGEAIGNRLLGVSSETWAEKSWQTNSRWSFDTNEHFLLRNKDRYVSWSDDLISQLRSACAQISVQLNEVDATDMTTVPIHGDFYPNNLLVDSGGQVVAVVDWDEARIDWRTWDVANALLEFCAGPAGVNLDLGRASEFVAVYESAALSLSATERSTLPLLIRARKLDELMYSIGETQSGAVEDWEYLNQSLQGWQQIQDLSEI